MLGYRLLIILLASWPFCTATAQQIGQSLPVWRQGYLDIHHINTGRGNVTFAILPDGTTLLIDAGSVNPIDWRTNKPRNLPIKPNGDRHAGEWIARYIRNVLRPQHNPAIDYAVITHFHDDHMGSPAHRASKSAEGYILTGITEVAEFVPIRTMLDRGWPDYDYPRSLASDSMVINYRQFLRAQVKKKGLTVERFKPGRNDQITLLKKPKRYWKLFEIINVAANGKIWSGKDTITRELFPDLKTIAPAQYPNENMCSLALTVRYGDFKYFAGGDLTGVLQFGEPQWHDVETPVAQVVDSIDVQVLDHHGYADSENGTLLARLKPRVLVIPAWAASHPGRDVLERLYSKQTYAGPRDVFVTNLLDETKVALGNLADRLTSTSGHVCVRVDPGGKAYRVFILDDRDESLRIKAVHGPYAAK
ncbi:ComEC/Rec2 family competence protein [Spirosoma oryzicola]|uniref:ComEC/Rec2 family competence protein n=1 Tax=Spirosoma oryzicola TaxID=2898794 RepID=UPI001E549F7B|nr:hypothetical protein [Spirosoma oryzicola]UHG90404.1 hypothetical protein LQ777_19390 [Spirosoma oryzicola]